MTDLLYFPAATILGLIIGSFLSMLIARLHSGEKGIFFGRSHCKTCKHVLKATDLIPLLSFLFLKGKCRYCKKQISIWYPLTEIGTAIIFAVAFYVTRDPIAFVLLLPILTVLGFIFFYDIQHKEIHDAVLIPGIIYAFILCAIQGNVVNGLIGAAVAGAFFGAQYLISKGTWIGSGDIRIGIFMGLFLGLEKTLLALMLSYILGSVVGIALIIAKKAGPKTAVPLGPFLVAGTMLAFIL